MYVLNVYCPIINLYRTTAEKWPRTRFLRGKFHQKVSKKTQYRRRSYSIFPYAIQTEDDFEDPAVNREGATTPRKQLFFCPKSK